MTDVESSFVRTVRDRGVDVVETTVAEAPAAIEAVAEPPVVGTPLEHVPVDLEDLDLDVETNPTPTELDEATTGITDTALGIADYGSVVVRGGRDGEEPVSLYPDHHVAVVHAQDIVEDMETAMGEIAASIRSGNRSHIVATGPSATADMGALVEGAHGPRSVTVVVVSEE